MKLKSSSKTIGSQESCIMEVYIESRSITREEAGMKCRLFSGEKKTDVVRVEQRLVVKTTDGKRISTSIINNIMGLGDDGIRFVTVSGSCYDLYISARDGKQLLHNLYENAKIDCNMCVSQKIRSTHAFSILRQVCA